MPCYYRWSEDLKDYGYPVIQLERLELRGLEEWDLKIGKKINNWSNENIGYFEEAGVAYDLLNTTMQIHIISQILGNVLESLELDDIQQHPLKILQEHGKFSLDKYCVLGVQKSLDCLDMEKSTFTLWGKERSDRLAGDIRDLRIAVLSAKKIGTHKIFRLAKWEVYMVIEEEIKRAIERAGCSGGIFTKLELST